MSAFNEKGTEIGPSTVESVQEVTEISNDGSGPPTPPETAGLHVGAGVHGLPAVVGEAGSDRGSQAMPSLTLGERFKLSIKGWGAYMKTRDFYYVLVLGQVLSLCITSTNTFSSLLANHKASIPSFQTLLNYIFLNMIYTSYTIYKYGPMKWAKMIWKDGWRFFILAFLDALGNYFFVLAYRYTTILSAQLINFWAIVMVVVVSFIFLKVRYHKTQVAGILICCGGMGLLIGSDHITGANGGKVPDQLKGDLFALAGATFYGLSNVFEEFLVSKRPLYEVVGQLAFWATPIMGVISAIFDRGAYQSAHWTPDVGGYLIGYTLILALFYSLAPVMFRLSSAAFFNISLLTANFWGTIIGIQVFHLTIYYLYPIAFVLIIVGLVVYFVMETVLGESAKPWLGENQEHGVDGIGTAKRKVVRANGVETGGENAQGGDNVA